jgi:guanylate cyclase
MKPMLNNVRNFLEGTYTLITDPAEERRRKVTLVVLSGICFVASIVWGTVYYVILGPAITVLITYGFTVVVGIALLVFLVTKRFGMLLYPFFLMILWNPIAMQWSLGGFAASGVLMTWSILAPFCALMFQSIRQAVWWFLAYLGLLAISLTFDDQFRQWATPMSHATSMLFFGMNIIGPAVAIFLSMMYFVNAFQREHARSEALLLNILPGPVAQRLKAGEAVIADEYSEVTILFADIVDFTKLAARTKPQELVNLLNKVFSAFDRLTRRHGLEKIKTIGDAYMVVGGLPVPQTDHATAIAEMALEMHAETARLGQELGEPLGLRIGIDSGPVVAGVIGEQKFAYDLWGDAVNTASRMESQGVADHTQLTESAYQRVKENYFCEMRGTLNLKGKTEMTTYFLTGQRNKA